MLNICMYKDMLPIEPYMKERGRPSEILGTTAQNICDKDDRIMLMKDAKLAESTRLPPIIWSAVGSNITLLSTTPIKIPEKDRKMYLTLSLGLLNNPRHKIYIDADKRDDTAQ